MAVIDIKLDPKPRDLKIFAALWVVFFVVLGKIAFFTDAVILKIAIFTSACFLISILLNRDFPKKLQLWGLLIPSGFWTIWFVERALAQGAGWFSQTHTFWKFSAIGAQWGVFAAVVAIGVIGSLLMLASAPVAKRVYRAWMFAALPIGWVISHIIMGVMYFLIVTPIGVLVRNIKGDPMRRAIDPAAKTYWIPHRQETDPKRYFQQF
jgi:hypothetical protein